MKAVNKLLAIIMSIMATVSVNVCSVQAEEILGNTLSINQDDADFNELFCMYDGKPYIPIRVAFPNLNDQNKKMGLEISWDARVPAINIRSGHTNGEGFIIEGEHTIVPFVGVRVGLDMFLKNQKPNGEYEVSLTCIEYTVDEDGYVHTVAGSEIEADLKNPVYLKPVAGGGDRVFVSIEDIKQISEWLQVDDNYSVKLYTITQ